MKIILKRIIIIVSCVFITFSILAFIGVNIAYKQVFSRADYDEYDMNKYLRYQDVSEAYPRETIQIPSGDNKLTGFLYGTDSTKGIIIVSPGHRDPNDIKLYEITYFVEEGWMVLCYDYTGCYNSVGDSMVGYTQATKDLNAVLNYVEVEKRFMDIPILLFGHSLGAYASASVLQYEHKVTAVVAASGFDDPKEQWEYSVKRSTGIFGTLLKPYAGIYMDIKFGAESHLSAIDGINTTDIPVLVISGTDDEYYGRESKIYERQDKITNTNCTFWLMDEENHEGHYDYFLTNEAIDYQEKVRSGAITTIDKKLYMEHDTVIMVQINAFYLNALDSQ